MVGGYDLLAQLHSKFSNADALVQRFGFKYGHADRMIDGLGLMANSAASENIGPAVISPLLYRWEWPLLKTLLICLFRLAVACRQYTDQAAGDSQAW